jgi:hypothetical protein
MFFILGKTFHHIPHCVEEQVVEFSWFKQAQAVERFGQGEDHVKISCWKQFRFSCLDPPLTLYLLALGTMTIPARIVTNTNMATTCA